MNAVATDVFACTLRSMRGHESRRFPWGSTGYGAVASGPEEPTDTLPLSPRRGNAMTALTGLGPVDVVLVSLYVLAAVVTLGALLPSVPGTRVGPVAIVPAILGGAGLVLLAALYGLPVVTAESIGPPTVAVWAAITFVIVAIAEFLLIGLPCHQLCRWVIDRSPTGPDPTGHGRWPTARRPHRTPARRIPARADDRRADPRDPRVAGHAARYGSNQPRRGVHLAGRGDDPSVPSHRRRYVRDAVACERAGLPARHRRDGPNALCCRADRPPLRSADPRMQGPQRRCITGGR